MKSIFTLGFILAIGYTGLAQHQLDIKITGLESSEGFVMVDLVDEKGQSIKGYKLEIEDRIAQLQIKELKKGTYGIRYFHDENANEEMDTVLFGIPKEGYGFSNNARGNMGPPKLEDYLFSVEGDLSMTLRTVN